MPLIDRGPDLKWTPAQLEVIEAPPEARLLVVADAGTGKTEVLIQRLAHLVSRDDFAPGSEMLTVSFTRTAVGEIKSRLSASSTRARYSTVVTFDSYATRLLARHSTADAWREGGYETRIRAVTELIDSSEPAQAELSELKHFAVDEVQDLVGVRLEFVQRIIEQLSSGFLVLGDPAQAIYNWQAGDNESANLFEWLRQTEDQLREVHFSGSFRAETDEARQVLGIGRALNEVDPDYDAISKALLQHVDQLPRFASIEQLAGSLTRAKQTTAVLCRNNGQALEVSGALWSNGVDHQLREDATERAVVAWMGRLMSQVRTPTLSKASCIAKAERAGVEVDTEEMWSSLKRVERQPGDSLSIDTLRRNIAIGFVPDDLTSMMRDQVVVSTIHRAKGLEFGVVVLMKPAEGLAGENLADETRTLYVAMTRPRRYTMLLPEGIVKRIRRDERTGRWFRSGPQPWQTFGFEVRGDDTMRLAPSPGADGFGFASVKEAQDYLWSEVHAGDAVEFCLKSTDRAGLATYELLHESKTIGAASDHFVHLLSRRLHRGRNDRRWPVKIHDLRIDGVDTVAGTSAASEQAGLGSSGLWIRPRVVGLSRFEW